MRTEEERFHIIWCNCTRRNHKEDKGLHRFFFILRPRGLKILKRRRGPICLISVLFIQSIYNILQIHGRSSLVCLLITVQHMNKNCLNSLNKCHLHCRTLGRNVKKNTVNWVNKNNLPTTNVCSRFMYLREISIYSFFFSLMKIWI